MVLNVFNHDNKLACFQPIPKTNRVNKILQVWGGFLALKSCYKLSGCIAF